MVFEDKEKFFRYLDHLAFFFGKHISEKDKENWFREFENFPLLKLLEAFEEYKKANTTFPKPAEIYPILAEILAQEEPLRLEKDPGDLNCPYCGGRGLIFSTEIHSGHEYEVVGRCICNKNRYTGIPISKCFFEEKRRKT